MHRILSHSFSPQTPTVIWDQIGAEDGSQAVQVTCRWQEPSYLSHDLFLPRFCLSSQELELGVKLKYSSVGYEHLNCSAK